MLGFRGHLSTKSRCYSTTLTALRQARQQGRNQRLIVGLGYSEKTRVHRHKPRQDSVHSPDEETIFVIGNWQYTAEATPPSSRHEPPALLSVQECAVILGLSRTMVFSLIRDGALGSVKVGTRRLVPRAAVERFVRGSGESGPVIANHRPAV
jgi:excisionase family DNA binding protein